MIDRLVLSVTAIAAALCVCGADVAQATAPNVVKVGVASLPFPPFTWRDPSGAWIGFDIDLQRAVCEVEALQCEVVEVAWEDLIPALLDKRIDVIGTPMGITQERAAVIDFSEMYYDYRNVLIGSVSDGTNASITNPSSLKGKAIGVQVATVYATFVTKYFDSTAEVRSYDTLDAALADLAAGRLDYVAESAMGVTPFLESNPSFAIKADLPPDPILGTGVAAALRQQDDALRQKINHGIAALVRSGRYGEILRTYPGLGDQLVTPRN